MCVCVWANVFYHQDMLPRHASSLAGVPRKEYLLARQKQMSSYNMPCNYCTHREGKTGGEERKMSFGFLGRN